MGLRGKAFRGSAVLAVGEAVGYGASFVRNMILARILTKADFGIAATLAMAIALLEFSSKLGVARFVVRDKEGEQEDFMATAQVVQAGAAVLSALLMLAAAWPLSILFGIREHVQSLGVLALIPLLNGFVHLDIRRLERHLRFVPTVSTEAIPQLVITALAWPVGVWLHDYRAVLLLLILKALMTCLGSHWFAERPYRWVLHRDYARRMIRFGWPMIVNGFLMFFLLRGDQFLVASFYSMSDLGAYAAAASLTTAPTLVFSRVFASVMLPVMARVQDDPVAFNQRYGLAMSVIAAFTAAYAVGVILGAESLMRLAFGPKYAGSGLLLAWLTAGNALRNLRLATAIAAMAKGDSVNEMVSNMAGAVALALAASIALAGYPVWLVASAGAVGGLIACGVSFRRLARRDGVPLRRSLIPLSLVGLGILVSGAASYWHGISVHSIGWLAVAVVGGLVAGGLVLVALSDSRQEALHLLRRRGFSRGIERVSPNHAAPAHKPH